MIIKFLRSFIVFLEMSLFGAGALIIGGVIFPFLSLFLKNENRRKVFASIIQASWNFFIFIMIKTGMIKVKINGNLSEIKGKVVAASHPSLIDIILLMGNMPPSLCLAKKELLNNFFMKNIVKSLYIVNDIEAETFKKETTEALNLGYNIIIFPTGTRTLKNDEIKIHKGAAQIAISSNANIVPVKIEADYPFLYKNKSPFDAGEKATCYTITVLDEIKTGEYSKEIGEIKIRNLISERIKKALFEV